MRLPRLVVLLALVPLCQAQILFTHSPDGGPPWPIQDVWVMDSNGANPQGLTTDGHSHNPVWSPDGRQVLYVHDAALPTPPPYKEEQRYQSHHPIEIMLMDRNGGNRRVLWRSPPVIYSAAWSPDGKTLAVSGVLNNRVQLFLLSADGAGVPQPLFDDAWNPAWSPDGKRIAFSVEAPRGQWAIHVANADGTNDARLNDPQLMSGLPAWSPDGRFIAFSQAGQQIYVMDADGSHARQITHDASSPCDHPSWMPDGRCLVVSCRSSNHCGGISSVGTRLPECTRRLFSIDVLDTTAKPAQLADIDAGEPSAR